jgi:YidC/Oxa1 family membrane protein insertase
MMKYMMIFFGVMFYKVAAGLCLYFIISGMWSLAERKLLPKAKPTPGVAAAPAKPARAAAQSAATRSRSRAPKGQPNGTFRKVQDWWTEVLKQAKKK